MSQPQWSELKQRARSFADRGRVQWRRARVRLQRLSTGARDPGLASTAEPEPQRDGSQALALAPETGVDRALLTTAKVVGGLIALVALAILLLLLIWDWDWFRGPLSRMASGRLHRPVAIQGHIRAHLLTWSPEVTITNLKIGEPAWAGRRPDVADIPRLTVRTRWAPLFVGRVELPLVAVERPDLNLYSDARGRANWKSNPDDDKAVAFPPIQHLVISDGHLRLEDVKRKLTLNGVVNTSEEVTGSGRGVFRLQGQGSLNNEPFVLRITGAPLIDVRRDRPYVFDADLTAGRTHIDAKGAIDRPFDFSRYHAALAASGRDLSELYGLTGVSFPATPPYSVRGQFSRDRQVYRLSRFSGQVGASDLSGDFTLQKRSGRRLLQADLVSRSLDWKDLAQVMGMSGEATRAAHAPVGPRPPVAHPGASPTEIKLERLRAMDADVRFRATAVRANRMRLNQVLMRVRLDRGVLDFDPLSLNFAQGRLAGSVRTDARRATALTNLDLTLSNYSLGSLIPARGGVAPLTAMVDARAKLHGAGLTITDTLKTANGTTRLTVPHGEIRRAFAELLGINVGRGLSLLFSKDENRTDLRCAAADFDVSNGVMRVRDMTIDTSVVVSQGSGAVNLANRTLDLTLKGQSKKPRLLKLWSPIRVQGAITHPSFGVEKAALVTQGGVAAALGVLVNPLAAVLPFITSGGARDVDCAALLAGRPAAPAAPARSGR